MRGRKIGLSALVGAACLVGQYMAVPMVANAAGTAPMPFSDVHFSAYGDGNEVALSALNLTGTPLANVGQGLSSAATNHDGLTTKADDDETGNAINPAEPASVKAYGSGAGLTLGLAAPADQQQALLAGKATSVAPPVSSEVTKQIGPFNFNPLLSAAALVGRSDAVYDAANQDCPLGQPISYGYGNAANVQLASINPGSQPLANTAGTGTTTANSTSETYVNANGDGSFGIASQSSQIIAPITANLLNLVKLQITVGGANVNSPVTLNATASGEASKAATIAVTNNEAIDIKYSIAGGAYQELPDFPVTPAQLQAKNPTGNGLNLPLSTTTAGTALINGIDALSGTQLLSFLGPLAGSGSAIGNLLSGLLNQLGAAAKPLVASSLGEIDIEARPHAIGGSATSQPVATADGKTAAGEIDLLHVNLGLTGSLLGMNLPTTLANLVNLNVGHLETSTTLSSNFSCSIPVIKTATPSTVTAGNDFVYTIAVPDPAKLDLLACSLDDLSVVDSISDVPPGQSTFQVVSATEQGATGGKTAGKIVQPSNTMATVSWSGLSYTTAPVGATPTPPDVFTITVTIPKDSKTGTLQDTATAAAALGNCTGGASNTPGIGGVTGTKLAGSYHLVAPKVNAAPAASLTSQAAGSATPGSLPKTGGEGGLWQPGLGLGILLLGGGAFGLVRRSRRQSR